MPEKKNLHVKPTTISEYKLNSSVRTQIIREDKKGKSIKCYLKETHIKRKDIERLNPRECRVITGEYY